MAGVTVYVAQNGTPGEPVSGIGPDRCRTVALCQAFKQVLSQQTSAFRSQFHSPELRSEVPQTQKLRSYLAENRNL